MRPLIDWPNQRKTVSDHFWFWTTPTRAIWVCRIHSPDSGTSNLSSVCVFFLGFHQMNGIWHHLILLLKLEWRAIDSSTAWMCREWEGSSLVKFFCWKDKWMSISCAAFAHHNCQKVISIQFLYLFGSLRHAIKTNDLVRVTCTCLPKSKINEYEQSKLLLKLHLIHF